MRIYTILAVLFGMQPWVAHATTIEQAMNMAQQTHPNAAMADLAVEEARASQTAQSAYAYQPDISIELQDRKLNAGGSIRDYYIGVSQGIELWGTQGFRESAAQAELDLRQAQAQAARKRLAMDAARAFVRLYITKQTLAVRRQQSEAMKALAEGLQRRLQAGDANVLDANLAQSTYRTALRQEAQARQDYAQAKMRYASALGQEHVDDSRISLPMLNTAWQAPENALTIALRSRPELAAMQAAAKQARALADVADASRFSDPTISLMKGREAGEDLIKLGISFALPISNNKKGEYQVAEARAATSEQQLAWFTRQLKWEVQAAWENHRFAMQAYRAAYQVPQGKDSMILAKKAFDAGELGLEDLVVHTNQALEARLTTLSIIEQGWNTRIRLAEVLGRPEFIIQGIKHE